MTNIIKSIILNIEWYQRRYAMEKKKTAKWNRADYYNSQVSGGAVFYDKNGKVVADTRPKKAGGNAKGTGKKK